MGRWTRRRASKPVNPSPPQMATRSPTLRNESIILNFPRTRVQKAQVLLEVTSSDSWPPRSSSFSLHVEASEPLELLGIHLLRVGGVVPSRGCGIFPESFELLHEPRGDLISKNEKPCRVCFYLGFDGERLEEILHRA